MPPVRFVIRCLTSTCHQAPNFESSCLTSDGFSFSLRCFSAVSCSFAITNSRFVAANRSSRAACLALVAGVSSASRKKEGKKQHGTERVEIHVRACSVNGAPLIVCPLGGKPGLSIAVVVPYWESPSTHRMCVCVCAVLVLAQSSNNPRSRGETCSTSCVVLRVYRTRYRALYC